MRYALNTSTGQAGSLKAENKKLKQQLERLETGEARAIYFAELGLHNTLWWMSICIHNMLGNLKVEDFDHAAFWQAELVEFMELQEAFIPDAATSVTKVLERYVKAKAA